MGRVVVTAKVENLADVLEARDGLIPQDNVRLLDLDDALVDIGAKMLSLPHRTVEQLGLVFQRKRSGRTPAGTKEFDIYSPVRLTIQGRDCVCEVAGIPDDCPPLIGQLPLEMLDFYVDPAGQRLIGNPEHGGEHMIDMF